MNDLEQLLDRLDNSREQFLVAIEPLPDEALITPGAVDDWSIADVMINLTAWEAELVTALLRLDRRQRPDNLLAALADPEAYDAVRHAETQGRDLDLIFDDWQLVRVQLEEWLENFSASNLTNPRRYRWFKGKSLRQIIEETTINREKRFLPTVTAFAQAWVDQNATESELMIPLTAVSLEDEHDNNQKPD